MCASLRARISTSHPCSSPNSSVSDSSYDVTGVIPVVLALSVILFHAASILLLLPRRCQDEFDYSSCLDIVG